MTQTACQRPSMARIHHLSSTVTDVEASAAWYQRVLGLERIPPRFPHFGNEETGYAVVLADPATGVMIGLHHIAIAVPARSDLDAWAAWLDHLDVPHAGVNDATDPVKYSVLVFRDPDNIQLELFFMET